MPYCTPILRIAGIGHRTSHFFALYNGMCTSGRLLAPRKLRFLGISGCIPRIIEKVGPWSIFSRPKNGSTSLQNSLFEHNAKSRSASKRRKNGSTSLQNSLFDSAQLCSRSYFAVTSWLLRSHFAVTTWLLRSRYGYYAVFTRLLRSLCGHYGYYAVRKSTYSRLRKRSTSLQNGLFDQNIVAVLISLLLQNGSIIPQIGFKFDSIMRKNGFNNATCLPQQ